MASIRKRATKAGVVYDVHYRDMTGASRQKSFRRKAEADKFRATVVADMARGDWIDPRRAPSGPKAEHRYLTPAAPTPAALAAPQPPLSDHTRRAYTPWTARRPPRAPAHRSGRSRARRGRRCLP